MLLSLSLGLCLEVLFGVGVVGWIMPDPCWGFDVAGGVHLAQFVQARVSHYLGLSRLGQGKFPNVPNVLQCLGKNLGSSADFNCLTPL